MAAGRSESKATGDIKGKASEFPLPRHARSIISSRVCPSMGVQQTAHPCTHACVPIIQLSCLCIQSITARAHLPHQVLTRVSSHAGSLLIISLPQATKSDRDATQSKSKSKQAFCSSGSQIFASWLVVDHLLWSPDDAFASVCACTCVRAFPTSATVKPSP